MNIVPCVRVQTRCAVQRSGSRQARVRTARFEYCHEHCRTSPLHVFCGHRPQAPGGTPKGYSAKGSKDEGKDAQTSHAGGKEGAKASKSEKSGEAPSGVNDMEIPHMHLPEMLHQKEGDEVHLHVYGKLKAHNMEKGKNHSVVEVTKVHRDGEENKATPNPNAATMPMDALKQSLKASSDTYSKE